MAPCKPLVPAPIIDELSPGIPAVHPKTNWLERAPVVFNGGGKLTFRFLNRSEVFTHGVQWSSPGRDRLWNYNLHYFDYLMSGCGMEARTAQSLIDDWVTFNPPGTPDAWDPFPISLRIVNWLKYASLQSDRIPDDAVDSLKQQSHWLERRIEYHLLGNHLFKNGKALLFAGLCFAGEDAARWLRKGKRIIEREVVEQVLPDGGHFERSPMYHAMIFEDVLDMLNILPVVRAWSRFRELLERTADKMAQFIDALTHPDGQIALFNDAALNVEATPRLLVDYYERVTGASFKRQSAKFRAFESSGYFLLAPDKNNGMLLDCGAVGPDYQPGHAHCDTLSFELSLFGRRVIVDSGCCLYVDSKIRKYNRGNAGHNTLTVDGCNQSEVWGAHRCARRAYPITPEVYQHRDGTLVFQGAHDGYKRLKDRPIHHRRVEWKGRRIVITDRVEGNGRHDLESRLHLHPELDISSKNGAVIITDGGRSVMNVAALGKGRISIGQGWYCPEFGLKIKCPLLSLEFDNIGLPFTTGWVFTIGENR